MKSPREGIYQMCEGNALISLRPTSPQLGEDGDGWEGTVSVEWQSACWGRVNSLWICPLDAILEHVAMPPCELLGVGAGVVLLGGTRPGVWMEGARLTREDHLLHYSLPVSLSSYLNLE